MKNRGTAARARCGPRRRAQGAQEYFLVLGAIVFMVVLVYGYMKEHVIADASVYVEAMATEAATELASITPSPRVGNVGVGGPVVVPTPCGGCGQNSTCPAGEDLIQACEIPCAYDECSACAPKCGFNCKTIQGSGYYALTEDLEFDGDCFIVPGNNVWIDCRGRSITGSGEGTAVLVTQGSANNFSIFNCTIAGFDVGINLTNSNNARIHHNLFREIDYAVVDVSSNNLWLYANEVVAPGLAGVYLASSNNANISGNNISQAPAYAIVLNGSAKSGAITDNNLSGGTCAIFNCVAGSCSKTCSANSGNCKTNAFSGNSPQECTGPTPGK
ncbi:MAG: NosD domain-containing protein [Candidatus Micrarchaeota archaeon]